MPTRVSVMSQSRLSASSFMPSSQHERIGTLDLTDAVPPGGVETFTAFALGVEVLAVLLPVADGLFAGPVGDGDPDVVRVAGGLDAEEAGLLLCQLDHAIGERAVAVAVCGRPEGGEDHGPVGRLGGVGQSVDHAASIVHPENRIGMRAWKAVAHRTN